jgi:HAD superfamily hydrolase (TIGR01484 family)
MRYMALATDYDGTLAQAGCVTPETLAALHRLRSGGRKLILVTGRELEDLMQVFTDYALFDRIVAENGALLFDPASREERALGEPPPAALVERLRSLGVTPLSTGRVIVATWTPHEQRVLDAIHELGLELQVVFNKGAVMVLPSGINKASGLRAALAELSLSPHNVVAIGDAENDHALLAECELGAAVANALPMLRERADRVTSADHGAGVVELIDQLLASDLRELEPELSRHDIELGATQAGGVLKLHPYGGRLLICGTSGAGKSTLVAALLERLAERKYQYCLVDPEGDFGAQGGALMLGDEQHPPKPEEVADVLAGSSEQNVMANLLAVPLDERADFYKLLVARCIELRARTGRPHWLVVDEAHHMLSASDAVVPETLEQAPEGLLLITVHPSELPQRVLETVDLVIIFGHEPQQMLDQVAEATGQARVCIEPGPLPAGQALAWRPRSGAPPERFSPIQPSAERRRHRRKYAAGELGEDKSFYFRGPKQRLNLRAQNLMLFLQMGDGVDDATWLHHLRQHDYSQWLRSAIKNDELAEQVARIEHEARDDADHSRRAVREAIEKIYTGPA